MSIISRYLLREFLKILLLSVATFITFYLILDFFDRIGTFIAHNASPVLIALYFLYKIPLVISQVTPVATLLSAVLVLGLLARNTEIIAMEASGVSIYRIIRPLLIAAAVVSVLVFWENEKIVPRTNALADHILTEEVEGHTQAEQYQEWRREGPYIMRVQIFDPGVNSIHGVTIFDLQGGFSPVRRLDARLGLFREGTWRLYDVVERHFSPSGETTDLAQHDELDFPLEATPRDFQSAQVSADEMSYMELGDFIQRARREGYTVTKYLVQKYAKLALPLAPLLMTLLGIPFALRTGRHGGMALGVGIAVFLAFIYWILLSTGISLGNAGALPPLLAAWAANFLFGLLGCYLLLAARF